MDENKIEQLIEETDNINQPNRSQEKESLSAVWKETFAVISESLCMVVLPGVCNSGVFVYCVVFLLASFP